MKLKVCGMKYVENIQQVAGLQPDYMGFIFYDQSKRNFEGILPELPATIKKTGVFVNEYLEIVISLVEEYRLDAVQLHGDESVEYVQELQAALAQRRALFLEENRCQKKKKNKHVLSAEKVELIKVFGVKDTFDFESLKPYTAVVDYFLFDTKGKDRGGNGIKFDWAVLKNYPFDKPFFLSGGIGSDDVEEVQKLIASDLPIYALDVNSQFEIAPGMKDFKQLQQFKNRLSN